MDRICPRRSGLFLQENRWNLLPGEKQMTIDLQGSIGASPTPSQDWKSLPWDKARQEVRRLQMRIAKAIKEKKYGRARSLQWILTHSHAAKMLAVQRVTTNKGRNTPGVDGKVWRSDRQKLAAISLL